MRAGAMPSDLRLRNRMSVLDAFRRGSEYTVSEIAAATGISRQTVSKAVRYFLEKELISDAGKGSSTDTGGKRPQVYRFSCKKVLLSVSAWPGTLSFTLMDMNSDQICRETVSKDQSIDPKEYFTDVGRQIPDIIRRNGIPKENLYGVALSIPGTIDYRTNHLRYSSISPSWGTDIPVEEIIRPYIGDKCVLFLENAGKMTGRAMLSEPDVSKKRILSLFTTWGFSACLIDKGRILNGKDALIGEIGHMIIDPSDTERCGCGGFGCLERQVSESRIRRIISDDRDSYPSSSLFKKDSGEIQFADVFHESSSGDDLARILVSYLAKHAAAAIRNITLVFDPDLVVFQGNFAQADEWFDRHFREALLAFQYYPPGGAFEVRYDRRPLTELNDQGAANSLTDMFFKDPGLY